MTYPKFGATFFDLGWQLPRQILKKSKKFQNSKFFLKILNLNQGRISPQKFGIFWTLSKFDAAIANPNQKRLLQILDMSYI